MPPLLRASLREITMQFLVHLFAEAQPSSWYLSELTLNTTRSDCWAFTFAEPKNIAITRMTHFRYLPIDIVCTDIIRFFTKITFFRVIVSFFYVFLGGPTNLCRQSHHKQLLSVMQLFLPNRFLGSFCIKKGPSRLYAETIHNTTFF